MAIQPISGFGGRPQEAAPPKPARAAEASGAPPPAAPAEAARVSREQVEHAVRQIQKAIEPVARDLQFSIDHDTGKTVVRIVDAATNEVIRQIPSEELLEISRAMGRMQGLLLKHKA